jgi:hypothetical protein
MPPAIFTSQTPTATPSASIFPVKRQYYGQSPKGLNRQVHWRLTLPKISVANYGGATVTVYAPGSKSVLRTISKGVRSPYVVAFDNSGDLYVANR